ncbi:MAG: DUF2892 domain-containing protein [Flavobacteriales bacterium]|jgi:hypothetical protein|tara:strand:- start:5372 stop:5587 length:216 start_codon:yes stop_codon:yes gene_type:complete
MNKNIGTIDKTIRIVAAVIISMIYITGTVAGILGFILLTIGGILLITAVIDFCPLYKLFKFKGTKSLNNNC